MTDTIILDDGTKEEYYKVYVEEGFAICIERHEHDLSVSDDAGLAARIVLWCLKLPLVVLHGTHYHERAVTYPEHRIEAIK